MWDIVVQNRKYYFLLQVGIAITTLHETFGLIDISNSNVKQCLTVDRHDINDLGPGKLKLNTKQNKYVIIIRIKKILILILFWQ